MAIVSIWRIEFVAENGTETRLLDYGDDMENDLEASTSQQSFLFPAPGYAWASVIPMGGSTQGISWTKRRNHGSQVECRSYCQTHPAFAPIGVDGKLRIISQGGTTYYHRNAVITGVSTDPATDSAEFESITTYLAVVGEPSLS